MDLMTFTFAGLVPEQAIPPSAHTRRSRVSLDSLLDRIVSSTAPIAQVADDRGDPHSVAALITDRLGVGFGATTAQLFVFHHEQLTAANGVIVGVNEHVVQLADERKNLHTWPSPRSSR